MNPAPAPDLRQGPVDGIVGAPSPKPLPEKAAKHVPALDGVRGLSILFVLAAHLLPLKSLWPQASDSVGLLGMSLFFVLSGYFIVGQVLQRKPLVAFVAQRLLRVVPLAWLCAAVVAVALAMPWQLLAGHVLFYANLPPQTLSYPLDHYWSLCVEVQFYALAALLLCLRPALTWLVIPVLLLLSTALRIHAGVTGGSITWYRADDILAGGCLALLMDRRAPEGARRWLASLPVLWASALLLCAGSLVDRGVFNPLNFIRCYAAAVWVGSLLCQPLGRFARWLSNASWSYLAAVSFAVYIIHLPLTATWLGSGDTLEKFLKRPLLLAVTFALAHLSTFHFERHFIAWGRRFGAQPRTWRGATSP